MGEGRVLFVSKDTGKKYELINPLSKESRNRERNLALYELLKEGKTYKQIVSIMKRNGFRRVTRGVVATVKWLLHKPFKVDGLMDRQTSSMYTRLGKYGGMSQPCAARKEDSGEVSIQDRVAGLANAVGLFVVTESEYNLLQTIKTAKLHGL